MRTAAEILAELRSKGVTQSAMAKVLGVQQPNVATLYNPAKNGKLRQLGYDEAIALIRAFGLDTAAMLPQQDGLSIPSESDIAKMIQQAMAEMPVGVSYEDYPQAVASSVHAQIARYLSLGGYQREGEETSRDTSAPIRKPTKPTSRAKSRTP